MPHCSRLPGFPPTHLHITHAEQAGQTQGERSILSLFISRWKIELWKEPTKKNKPTKQATKTKQLKQKPPLTILIADSSPGKKIEIQVTSWSLEIFTPEMCFLLLTWGSGRQFTERAWGNPSLQANMKIMIKTTCNWSRMGFALHWLFGHAG